MPTAFNVSSNLNGITLFSLSKGFWQKNTQADNAKIALVSLDIEFLLMYIQNKLFLISKWRIK